MFLDTDTDRRVGNEVGEGTCETRLIRSATEEDPSFEQFLEQLTFSPSFALRSTSILTGGRGRSVNNSNDEARWSRMRSMLAHNRFSVAVEARSAPIHTDAREIAPPRKVLTAAKRFQMHSLDFGTLGELYQGLLGIVHKFRNGPTRGTFAWRYASVAAFSLSPNKLRNAHN